MYNIMFNIFTRRRIKKTTPIAIGVFYQLPEQCYNCQWSEIANIFKQKNIILPKYIPMEFYGILQRITTAVTFTHCECIQNEREQI